MPGYNDRLTKSADGLRRWTVPIIGAGAVALATAVVVGFSPLHGQNAPVALRAAGSSNGVPRVPTPSATDDVTGSVAPPSQNSVPTEQVPGVTATASPTPKKGAIDPGTYAPAPGTDVTPPPLSVPPPGPLPPAGERNATDVDTYVKKMLVPSNGWTVNCGKIGYAVDAGSGSGSGALRFAALDGYGETKAVLLHPTGTTRLTVVSATCQRFVLKDDSGALFGYLPNASSLIPGG